MSDLAAPVELLGDLARVLEADGIAWYVFGAQAVAVYGTPRMTGDVDVTIRLDPRRVRAFVARMDDGHFALRVDDPEPFVAQARVLPFWHRPSGLPLDVVLAGPGLEDEFLARAVAIDLGGVRVPVLAAGDLIVTKILAGRPKDLDDVRGILASQGPSLDLAAVRETLAAIEEALGQSDLAPRLEALVTATKKPRTPRAP